MRRALWGLCMLVKQPFVAQEGRCLEHMPEAQLVADGLTKLLLGQISPTSWWSWECARRANKRGKSATGP